MNRLLLMRHAKSSWASDDMDDHDRPLNARGRDGADTMAAWLAVEGLRPDLALVSSSARTRETWERMTAVLGNGADTRISPALYHARPDAMFDALGELDDSCPTVLIIAHQPGMSMMARAFADGSEPDTCARAFQHYPTAAIGCFDVPVPWAEAAPGVARFTRFVGPKDL